MPRVGTQNPVAAPTAAQHARPNEIRAATARTAVVAVEAAGRGRCSQLPARAVAKKLRCHSSRAATSRCIVPHASNSVAEAAAAEEGADMADDQVDEDATKCT
jgi:hypothetical protein